MSLVRSVAPFTWQESIWKNATLCVGTVKRKMRSFLPFLSNMISSTHHVIYPMSPVTRKKRVCYVPQCVDVLIGKVQYLVFTFLYGKELENEAVQVRVQSVFDRLLSHVYQSKQKCECRCTVIDTEIQIITFLRGSRIVLSKGFIDAIDLIDLSEEEHVTKDDVLAAALGHNMGYVLTNRSLPLPTFVLLSWITTAVSLATWMSYSDDIDLHHKAAYAIAAALLSSPFLIDENRKKKYEMDKYAIHLMHRARYNIRGNLTWLKLSQLFALLRVSKKIVAAFFEKRNFS